MHGADNGGGDARRAGAEAGCLPCCARRCATIPCACFPPSCTGRRGTSRAQIWQRTGHVGRHRDPSRQLRHPPGAHAHQVAHHAQARAPRPRSTQARCASLAAERARRCSCHDQGWRAWRRQRRGRGGQWRPPRAHRQQRKQRCPERRLSGGSAKRERAIRAGACLHVTCHADNARTIQCDASIRPEAVVTMVQVGSRRVERCGQTIDDVR